MLFDLFHGLDILTDTAKTKVVKTADILAWIKAVTPTTY